MSVSRDFIDSYSPEASSEWPIRPYRTDRAMGCLNRTIGNGGSTTLVFGFRLAEDLLQTGIPLRQRAGLVLVLAEELLERPVQRHRLVALAAGARPVGAEPDQLLHVRVGRHHLLGPGDRRQVLRVGGPWHRPRYRFEDVDRRIAATLGD